ncbi:PKD domain-containing protein [Ilyomonas limi]|uniref:PKD domain-containing protein n=1 Tax=Ilyomonas limi TaxID=2575867 RepID=A0A4U3L494_9BACT|nr:PKD domain-containing protein [Ilyomonas limi]
MHVLLIGFIAALITNIQVSQAQYIDFVENKGQWNSKVNFTGELNGGAFYLQKNGYKVLLNSDDDWRRIAEHYSGHSDASANNPKSSYGAQASNQKLPYIDPKHDTSGHSDDGGSSNLILHSHAYEVTFVGANPNPQIVPERQEDTYNNYFIGNDPSKWATNCKIYQAVVYKNMYPGIDVRYYTDNDKLKYDFIVHPGADADKIALRFDGTDGLSIKKGDLIIKTSLGDVTELSPIAYYSSTSKSTVPAIFMLSGNTVRFKVDTYPKDATLTIDPTLVFLTYTGSKADNWGYTATYDGYGNLYAGGIVFGTGYPITNGAFQSEFGGGDQAETHQQPIDIGLTKFNPTATARVYSTYVGGSGDEQPHSLVVDNAGNLIIAGRTTSKNFPATVIKYGPDNNNGDFDIFLAKFNSNGGLVAGRRIGGDAWDGVNIGPKDLDNKNAISTRQNYGDDARTEVITDAAGNIYLASCTKSSDFPVTANAFQKTFGGSQDGVFIKTSPDIATIFCASYLGGKGDDAAFVLALNPTNNNVYIAGGTGSNNFPGITAGVLHATYQGGICDGFISVINNSTYALSRSTYFGTGGTDLIYGVQFDKFGFPYVMGTATGIIPVKNSAWTTEATGKQFISKLKPDLSAFEYSTNFGSGTALPDISPTAFLVDRCENVYVSGWSGGINKNYQQNQSSSRLKVTPNAMQSVTDGDDFYFFVLKRNASDRLYASFFGQNGGFGDHVDGGTSRFDRQGVIYQAICANCIDHSVSLKTYPPNVVGPYNGARDGSGCNLAAVKLAFELAGIGNGVRASIEGRAYDTTGCVPLTVDFTDTLALGKKYVWNFGDGSPDTTTTTTNVSHTYTQVGDYRVRLISIDSSACNIADTAYTTIRARRDKALLSLTTTKLPPCTNLTYQFNNTSQYPSGKPFGPKSFVWDLGDGTIDTAIQVPPHTYASEGTYVVKLYLIDSNYCNAPDVLIDTLRIAANVKAQFDTPPYGCAPYDAVFNNTSLAGHTFAWNFGDGSPIDSSEYPTHHYENPGTYTVTLTVFDSATCNKQDQLSKTILVSASPVAGFTFGPIPAQENTFTTFTNTSTGANSYKWIFGDGEELETVRLDTLVRHIYNRTDTFTVQLIAYNQYGCTDTATARVYSIVVPLVDVPNALSPFGTNRRVSVQGYGIAKIDWKIYNRWGTMVFNSTSQKTGWDGTYKGVVQPMDVYTYVLDVQFSDGTKYRKTGDITLIR